MDRAAMEGFYGELLKHTRAYLSRRFGAQDLDDRIHDVFVTVVEAVRDGKVLDVDRLGAFAYGVARMQVRRGNRSAMDSRGRSVAMDVDAIPGGLPSPELQAIERQRMGFLKRSLRCLPARQGEVVRRCLNSESKEEICAAMDLSATEFRMAKSRGLARARERFPKAA